MSLDCLKCSSWFLFLKENSKKGSIQIWIILQFIWCFILNSHLWFTNPKWSLVYFLGWFPLVFALLAVQRLISISKKDQHLGQIFVSAQGNHICEFQFKFPTFLYNSKWFLVKFLGWFPLVFDLLAVQRLISISGKDRHLGRKTKQLL